jgi:phosphoesterase RecJ-like protein
VSTLTEYPDSAQIGQLISDAQTILIMQADNPDADSLASALALEQILGDLDKEALLYCGVHIPDHLHHLEGWDRVADELPVKFDLSIIVDTSADSLFGALAKTASRLLLTKKPCIIIDHHGTEPSIPYATVVCSPTAVATGEVLYELAQQLDWPLNIHAKELLTSSILADSLGLTVEATSARSIHIVGELVDGGVSIAALEYRRRELMRKEPRIIAYKGRLLQRIEYFEDGQVAVVTIPWEEIEEYSHEYNPSVLVLDEMRYTAGVKVGIAFKLYNNGKVTAKIRCNYGYPVGKDLAEAFGGGGHPYASGFKVEDGRSFEEIKTAALAKAGELLNSLESRGAVAA